MGTTTLLTRIVGFNTTVLSICREKSDLLGLLDHKYVFFFLNEHNIAAPLTWGLAVLEVWSNSQKMIPSTNLRGSSVMKLQLFARSYNVRSLRLYYIYILI